MITTQLPGVPWIAIHGAIVPTWLVRHAGNAMDVTEIYKHCYSHMPGSRSTLRLSQPQHYILSYSNSHYSSYSHYSRSWQGHNSPLGLSPCIAWAITHATTLSATWQHDNACCLDFAGCNRMLLLHAVYAHSRWRPCSSDMLVVKPNNEEGPSHSMHEPRQCCAGTPSTTGQQPWQSFANSHQPHSNSFMQSFASASSHQVGQKEEAGRTDQLIKTT